MLYMWCRLWAVGAIYTLYIEQCSEIECLRQFTIQHCDGCYRLRHENGPTEIILRTVKTKMANWQLSLIVAIK